MCTSETWADSVTGSLMSLMLEAGHGEGCRQEKKLEKQRMREGEGESEQGREKASREGQGKQTGNSSVKGDCEEAGAIQGNGIEEVREKGEEPETVAHTNEAAEAGE